MSFASKKIQDCPVLLENQETLISIAEACKRFPQHPNIQTLYRWLIKGVRGARLESMLIGNSRMTSEEAIERSKRRQLNNVATEPSKYVKPSSAKVRPMPSSKVEAELKELGLVD